MSGEVRFVVAAACVAAAVAALTVFAMRAALGLAVAADGSAFLALVLFLAAAVVAPWRAER